MELTDLQEAMIKTRKSLNIPFSVVFPTMLYLKTEQEQLKLAVFLLENRKRKLSAEEIVNKVSEILNSEP